jgi:hypothetical protein
MAQADQIVQNDTFPAFRADLNNNLAALFSDNSGTVAPTPTVAFMDWIDTSAVTPVWRKRNAANNAWVTVGEVAGTALNVSSATTATTATNATNLTGTSTTNIQSAALASGTADNTTFLRGDRTWQTVSTSVTTQQVLDATAGLTAGAVGSYGFMRGISAAPGSTTSGGNLRWSNAGGTIDAGDAAPAGTWRLLGRATSASLLTLTSVHVRIS